MERLRIPTGDLVLDALATGPADGPVVLLLLGFPQTSWSWRDVWPALAEAGYRVVVPDNVSVDVRTGDGDVSFRGYRGSARVTTGSGSIAVAGYCGNSLDARADSGDIAFDADCAPPRLSLRSTSGTIRALIPPGRYDLDAESSAGDERVRGVIATSDAPYSVQVLSTSGFLKIR